MPESLPSARTIFFEALDLPEAGRHQFIRERCGTREALLREVEELLAAHRAADHFLEVPALGRTLWDETPDHDPWLDAMIGDYRIARRVGVGGMSRVYVADRVGADFEQRVAVKLVRRGIDNQETLRRFRTECRALARLQHPNIATMIDGGVTEDGIPYLIMEYVDGVRIDQHCDQAGLEVAQRLELFRTVCAAVHYAHRHFIVHRDLKPSNVLVDREGHVKLLDFGIARIIDPAIDAPERTSTTVRVMTPGYASPEQLRGESLTTSTDVYSLGVVLYKILTGHIPLDGDNSTSGEWERVVSTTPPTRPSEAVLRGGAAHAGGRRLARQLRGDLDDIVLMALRKEPERRYASVQQFSEDVRRHLTGLPVIAKPETVGYLTTKFLFRHRFGASVTATIALILVAFGVGLGFQAKRIAAERDRAQQVSGLLLDLFRSANPQVSRGDTITAVEILDRGVDRVRTSLRTQPDQLATLLTTIAAAYRGIGQPREARALSAEALSFNVSTRGAEHEATVDNLLQLTDLFVDVGRYDSALAYAESAVEITRRRFERSLLAGRALMVMGLVLHHKGELSAARDAQENAVRRFRALGDSTFLPGALVNLGWIEENEGTLDSAETRMRESVAIRRAHLDANDPLLLNSLGALADILRRQDAIEEGTAVAAEALALAESVYPHDHPRRLGLAALHASFVAPGDLDHVERFNRDALSADSLAYGGRSAVVASRLNRLGMLLFDGRGDARGAEPLFREAASVYGELRGSTNVQTLAIETSLATVLFAQGRMTEAASIFERTIPLLETARGTADESLALPLLNLGVIRIAFGRFEDAESLLRRAVAIERAEQSAGDLRIARAEAGLGAALVGLARYVEAEPLLLTAYEQLTRDPGPFDPYPRFTADALAALYTRMGRPADAQRYQRQR